MGLNDFIRVDDEDDVLAEDMNRNTASTLRGELGEGLNITSELALEDGDSPYLKLTPNADLDVLMPPEASTNHLHVLENGSSTYTLTVKDDSDTNELAKILPLQTVMLAPALGTAWKLLTGTHGEFLTKLASSSSITPTGGYYKNSLHVTALAEGTTINAPSGTPVDGNMLLMRFKDNGTGRALAYNAIFRDVGVTRKTATTANKTLYQMARYNAADTKWDIVAVVQEA